MKKTIILLTAMMISTVSCTKEKETPVVVATDSVVVVNEEPESKKVCITNEKTGKQTCRTMKVHKKLDGTPVPTKK